jgi:glycosyltransferase involved in cell wall biosynthesis
MKIHYYMQYFPGADAVGSRQPFTFSRFLADRGHDVTVVACNKNIDTAAREKAHDEGCGNGGRLKILRLPCLPGGRGSNAARLAAYNSFMVAALARAAVLPRPDVILGSIQPLFTRLAALAVARLKKVPFVLEVRDLWPDALVVKKAITAAQAWPLFVLTNMLYRQAGRIVSITPGIRKELVKKGIPASRIDVFPNGFDPLLFRQADALREQVRQAYGWGNCFVAIYVGSFTKVTAMDVVVRAAARLRDAGIRFEFFGNGPARGQVEQLARDLGAGNVTFHDPVPKVQVPGLLAAADIALMSLFKTPLAHIYFENKFMDYMGSGKAIAAAMEGEQADMIRRYDLGRVVAPGDDAGLSQLVREASLDTPGIQAMGLRGKALVDERLLLPAILQRYGDVLEAAASGTLSAHPAWEPAP